LIKIIEEKLQDVKKKLEDETVTAKDIVEPRQAVMDAYRTLLELVGKFIPPVKERPKPMPVPMPPVENPIPPTCEREARTDADTTSNNNAGNRLEDSIFTIFCFYTIFDPI